MNPLTLMLVGAALLLLLRNRAAALEGDATTSPEPDSSGDFPGAEWIPAKSFRAVDGPRAISYIVIHITDGAGNARNTAEYFASGAEGREVSAHYVVGRAGEVFQCVAERDIAYHAHSANSTSIGVENSARSAGELGASDAGLPVTDANYRATAELCSFLCRKYGLPRDRSVLVGHNEIDSQTTHSDCPTGQWDWAVFMAVLEETP